MHGNMHRTRQKKKKLRGNAAYPGWVAYCSNANASQPSWTHRASRRSRPSLASGSRQCTGYNPSATPHYVVAYKQRHPPVSSALQPSRASSHTAVTVTTGTSHRTKYRSPISSSTSSSHSLFPIPLRLISSSRPYFCWYSKNNE